MMTEHVVASKDFSEFWHSAFKRVTIRSCKKLNPKSFLALSAAFATLVLSVITFMMTVKSPIRYIQHGWFFGTFWWPHSPSKGHNQKYRKPSESKSVKPGFILPLFVKVVTIVVLNHLIFMNGLSLLICPISTQVESQPSP